MGGKAGVRVRQGQGYSAIRGHARARALRLTVLWVLGRCQCLLKAEPLAKARSMGVGMTSPGLGDWGPE